MSATQALFAASGSNWR